MAGLSMTSWTPPLGVIVVAERKAWREIAFKTHGGLTLTQAVKKQMESFLFWQREVYERIPGGQRRINSQRWNDFTQPHQGGHPVE